MSLLEPPPWTKVVIGSIALGVLVWWIYVGWSMIDAFSSQGPPAMGHIPVGAVCMLAFVGLAFVGILFINRRQRAVQAVRDAQSRAQLDRLKSGESLSGPLFLYLRPFASREQRTATEQLVIQLFESYGSLVCVDEPEHQHGIGRVAFQDDDWQSGVLELCEWATAIIIKPGASDGTHWELMQLVAHGWMSKTLVFMPPNIPLRGLMGTLAKLAPSGKDPLRRLFDLRVTWQEARARARDVGVDLPSYEDAGGLYRFTDGRAELLSSFDRDHLLGKPPRRALAALVPVVEQLVASGQEGDEDSSIEASDGT